MKFITDYGVMMEIFLTTLPKEDQHKSFIVKIKNKLHRYHKKRLGMCRSSEVRVMRAIGHVKSEISDTRVGLGPMLWLMHNRHKEAFKPYNFDSKWFEQVNQYYNAQGFIMKTAVVLNKLEATLND